MYYTMPSNSPYPSTEKNSRIKRTGRKIWKGKIAQASKI